MAATIRFSGFLLASAFLLSGLAACAPSLPENTPVTEARWLDQNWDGHERFWFHHATQGTSTLPVPYAWFVALEQPTLSLAGEPGLLSDEAYLRRFGFIPSPSSLDDDQVSYGYAEAAQGRRYGSPGYYDRAGYGGNPQRLPVGFVRSDGGADPVTGEPLPDQIGFTCAACHTGHLEYRGVSLRIDGAPAMTNLGALREVIGLSLVYTRYVPFRFGRFADRVLGPDHSDEAEAALSDQLDSLLAKGKAIKAITDPIDEKNVEEGFARLDALNRIGNQVFFSNLMGVTAEGFDASQNYEPISAPVNYPHIWNTSWFNWVQYDGSIMQPMVRNAGEALGVSARINMVGPKEALYRSWVKVEDIFQMEELLAGDDPLSGEPGFKGLRSPAWPGDLLGEIDAESRGRGEKLYQQICQGCHLPPVNDPSGKFWATNYWTTANEAGHRYLKVPLIPISKVGTDPAEAEVMIKRKVALPLDLDIDPSILCNGSPSAAVNETSFGEALAVVVEKTSARWYQDNKTSPEEVDRMNGYRPNCIQAKAVYKARPLDGIWATAPFLHNGSVPNLYALLSPYEERPKSFCLGSRLYDPVKVGYSPDCVEGSFELDTSIAGNHNRGHEFKDGPEGDGIIGRALSPEERMDLIAFLKSL